MIDGWAFDVDGRVDGAAAATLDDPKLLARILDELVGRVGMQILEPARMSRVAPDPARVAGDEDCGGVTGVVILTTSHATVHTWPLRGRISFDLYSCRTFDPGAVLEFLRPRLHLSGGTVRWVDRHHDPAHTRSFDAGPIPWNVRDARS